jgi:ParB family chromosome partitioning protein
MEDKFKLLPIGSITESKNNTRKHLTEEQQKELTESIKAKGIINPLIVRPLNGHYELIAGHRRLLCSKRAGLKDVPVLIKFITYEEAREIAIIDNLQREDIDPLDEAAGFQMLMDQGAFNVKLLSEKLGKSEKYIYSRLRLNKLIEGLKDLYYKGWLQPGHILLAAKYDNETQQKVLIALQQDETLEDDWDDLPEKLSKNRTTDIAPSVGTLKKWLDNNTVYDLSKVPFDLSDKILYKSAGDCNSCRKNTTNELSLFEGFKKNLCTDRTCRERKTYLYLFKKREDLKAKYPDIRCITTNWHTPKTELLKGVVKVYDSSEYKDSDIMDKPITKNSCKNTYPCLIINGDEKKIGQLVYRCFDRSCKVHNAYQSGSSSSGLSKLEQKKRNEYNKERGIRIKELNATRKEIHAETVKAFAKNPDIKQLLISAIITCHKNAVNFIEYSALKDIIKFPAGLKPPKEKDNYDSESLTIKQLNKMTERDLAILFLCNYSSKDIQLNNWQDYERTKNEIGKTDRLTFWSKLLLPGKKLAEIISKHKIARKKKKDKKK